jgi:hypothetical protein
LSTGTGKTAGPGEKLKTRSADTAADMAKFPLSFDTDQHDRREITRFVGGV